MKVILVALVLGVSSCDRGSPAEALPSASRASSAAPIVPAPHAAVPPSGSDDVPSPLPGLTRADVLSCKGMGDRGFEVTIEGDGEPQRMREGSRIALLEGTQRYCTAAGRYEPARSVEPPSSLPELTLFGCLSRKQAETSCISLGGQAPGYLDRDGRRWSVRVKAVQATTRADVLEGTAELLAERSGQTRKLDLRFKVGTRIPSVPEERSTYFAN